MSSQPPWGPPGPPGWGPTGQGPHGGPQGYGPAPQHGYGPAPQHGYGSPPHGPGPGFANHGYGPPPGAPFGGPGYGAPAYAMPPRKTSSGVVVAIIIAVTVALAAVGGLVAVGVYAAKKGASDAPSEVITASDGQTEIKVPSRWSKMYNLNTDARLQVGNAALEEYLVVISESKQDFAPDVDLDRYSKECLSLMRGRLDNFSASEPQEVTIEGRDAVQYEITGTKDLIAIGYVVTFVDGQRSFHQVIAWTMKSMLADKKKKLAEVTATFRER